MRKLVLIAAFAFGTLTAVQAQTVDQQEAQKDKQIAMNKQEAQEAPVAVQPVQDGFSEIQTAELPSAVNDAVATDFEGATVAKAYKNEKGAYKLSLVTADKQTKTVYANANGEWIKPKKGGA